jgi:hypothetical protein
MSMTRVMMVLVNIFWAILMRMMPLRNWKSRYYVFHKQVSSLLKQFEDGYFMPIQRTKNLHLHTSPLKVVSIVELQQGDRTRWDQAN